MKKTLQLTGLDCAGCAAELEEEIAKIEGVTSASVVFVTQKLTVEYDTDGVLEHVIHTANTFEEVRVTDHAPETAHTGKECSCGHCHHEHGHEHEHEHEHACGHEEHRNTKKSETNSHKKEWARIAVSAVLLALSLLLQSFGGKVFDVVSLICALLAYAVVAYPVLWSTVKNVSKGRIFDENFLMTIASVGAMCIGETSEGVLVMLLYQLGELLQSIAVGSSRRSVSQLMELKSEWATLITDGEQKQVNPETLRIGDRVLVKKGERVPVDGILLSEECVLDTKSLTGEAEFKVVKKGEEVLSGCINEGGMYEMSVLRPYEDSAVSRVLNMVENAAAGKAQPEKFIAKFAKYYTPIVCCLALAVAIFAPLLSGIITGEGLYFKDFTRWIQTALTFLVISCPCALVISVPLTYFSGIGTCAKVGALIKGSTYLDVIASARTVAFDKTGTLTEGNFEICSVTAKGSAEPSEMLALATAAERASAHPIAKAFADVQTSYTAEDVREQIGRGVTAMVNGCRILLGTETLLRENGVSVERLSSPYTIIHVARDNEYLGYFEIGDKVRAEAHETIEQLSKLGVSRTVMLTGDGTERAYVVANKLGIGEVRAELLPDQKLEEAELLKKSGTLLYVGDGINDAPVMAASDCAVSMGKLGSAAAVEASDVVLISDNLTALPKTIKIARKTQAVVRQNVIFSIVMKVLFLLLGLIGVLPLWLAVFADVGVMLLAVGNSFRVRSTKE